jgi:predicted O-methyltransferase YrrM
MIEWTEMQALESLDKRILERERLHSGSAGEGYITGLKQLYRDIIGYPARVVELGTWTGNSGFAWLSEGARLWSIDNNQDNSSSLVEDAKRYGWTPNLVCVKADSIEYAKEWTGPIDLLYVDTSHEYLQTRREVEAWIGHVRSGGFIVLDDAISYPDISKAFAYCLDTSCKGKFAYSTIYTGLDDTYTPKSHGLIVAKIK